MTERPMRILHALGSLDPGGVEMWLLNVLRHIDRDQFQFDFCTFGSQPGLHAGEAEKLGSKILRCPKGSNPWEFGRRFRRILREGGYDVVHSHVHFFSGTILRWASAEGVPVRIAHSHNSHDGRADTLGRGVYRRLMKSWIDRYATHGLAASQVAAAQLFGEDWQNDDRWRVLYYGVDPDQFKKPVDRDAIREELGIPADAAVVGHVGRFDEQKNHTFLVEIARVTSRERRNVRFLLIGDGPLRHDIEARCKQLGISGGIHFMGIRKDVPRLMTAMDVFIFPSLWEGLPVALVEAQAAGLNCVASDAISPEAALSPESVEFLPLSAGSARWAAEAIRMLAEPKKRSSLLTMPSNSKFRIQESVRDLAHVYRSNPASSAEIVEQHV